MCKRLLRVFKYIVYPLFAVPSFLICFFLFICLKDVFPKLKDPKISRFQPFYIILYPFIQRLTLTFRTGPVGSVFIRFEHALYHWNARKKGFRMAKGAFRVKAHYQSQIMKRKWKEMLVNIIPVVVRVVFQFIDGFSVVLLFSIIWRFSSSLCFFNSLAVFQ